MVLPTASSPCQKRWAMVSLMSTEFAPGISSRCSNPRPRSTGVPMVLRKFLVTELYLISKGGELANSVLPGRVMFLNMPLLDRLRGARTARATLRTLGMASKCVITSRYNDGFASSAYSHTSSSCLRAKPKSLDRVLAKLRTSTPAHTSSVIAIPTSAATSQLRRGQRRRVETPNAASPFKAGNRSGRADFQAGARPKRTIVSNETARLNSSTRESN